MQGGQAFLYTLFVAIPQLDKFAVSPCIIGKIPGNRQDTWTDSLAFVFQKPRDWDPQEH
jgi:hypothetical protein